MTPDELRELRERSSRETMALIKPPEDLGRNYQYPWRDYDTVASAGMSGDQNRRIDR